MITADFHLEKRVTDQFIMERVIATAEWFPGKAENSDSVWDAQSGVLTGSESLVRFM